MLHHDHNAPCPCHRVVRVDGQLGLYIAGAAGVKQRRLEAEAVEVHQGAVDLDRYRFEGFIGDRPLEKLTRLQESLAQKVSLRGRRTVPAMLGGVDVSYPSSREAVAAYALVDVASGKLIWSTAIGCPVGFPYISSYLTFRELPAHLALLDEVRAAGRMAEVILVDGTGVLHPRHVGIASHLGIVAGVATVGLTKKLLCGKVHIEGMEPQGGRPVVHQRRTIGMAIRPTAGSRRPIFVSPGHAISLPMAEKIVRAVLLGRRLPEPLYWADRISREY